MKEIAETFAPVKDQEKITGRARIIALFKGRQKGIILGCEVLEGSLALGKRFRLVSEPGTVYVGTIESLHIEENAVEEAIKGQQVGLKIKGFKRAKKGDLVECFEILTRRRRTWQPRGGVFDMRSHREGKHG
ncbi:MAG: hypothetical protein JRH06_03105 [Deltaproteobacteria bacterium]|nr:hypothetical protein [Deltaproteobacteria bacterium]